MKSGTSQSIDDLNLLRNPPEFSLVLGGPLFQLLRRARLSDDALTMVRRRIIVIALAAWLPLLVLSALQGMLGGGVAVPFLRDVEVHIRFLVAMPLLIIAELVVHQRMRPLRLTVPGRLRVERPPRTKPPSPGMRGSRIVGSRAASRNAMSGS